MQINLSSFMDYQPPADILRLHFLNTMPEDTLCIEEEITLDISLLDFLNTLKEVVVAANPGADFEYMHGYRHADYYMLTRFREKPQLFVQLTWHGDGDITVPGKAVFQVCITGEPKTSLKAIEMLRAKFPERLARVRWWFMAGDHLQFHDVVLHKPATVQPAYYPFMDQHPMEFMQGYLNHTAALLFLSGPAGTGKTTLLRNFLFENKLRAIVTYEDTLFNSDQMFVDFVTSNNHDVMIIEDADVMLGSRENTGNKMIARFLNASDGIIQLHQKKIVFTTNLSNFNDVDDALIRPGRSYGSVMFRALSPDEAVVAATAAGLQDFQKPERDVTLAEIFNPPNTSSFGKRKVGFGS